MPSYPTICDVCGDERDFYLSIADHGKWDDCCGQKRRQVYTPAAIQSNGHLYEYKAVAADVASGGKPPVITSKTQHKEFLRRNGYVEVGNETPKPRAPVQLDSPRNEIKKAMQQVLG
jgi:hypothetical protein